MIPPRDPRFPPVMMDGQRTPWGVPQQVAPGVMTPPRPRGRSSVPGAGGIVEVRNDHNYANIVDVNVPVNLASIRVLDQPTSLRNLLVMRNASAGTQIIFIGFGREASALSTLAINAGQMVMFDFVVPQEDIFALSSAAGGVLCLAYSTIPEV
jgi:hypothetical protein